MKNKGLYIHIPFCTHLCSYCDFTKLFYRDEFATKYLDELEKELKSYDIKDVTSIYIGGGTPSSLSIENFEKLLMIVSPYVSKDNSYALEANIENLTEDKIALLKKYGVNRISLGVQTFKDELLKIINRHHTKEEVIKVISTLIDYGFKDINIDLIYGLPNQTFEDLKSDLDMACSLPITHISTYSLMVNPNTKMYLDGYKEQDDETVRKMYDYIVSYLKEHGFNRYEVSNFSRPGYESKHNLVYWRNEEYYGIGLGASGYLNNKRYTNTKSLNKYLNGERIYEKEILSPKDQEFYRVMLGLRLREGISLSEHYSEKVKNLMSRGLLEKVGSKYKVTDENLFILDYILRELLD